MTLRAVLTIAVLASLCLAPVAEAGGAVQADRSSNLTAQIDGLASDGALGTPRVRGDR